MGWAQEIIHHAPGVPFILVGNKLDLRHDQETLKTLQEHGHSPVSKKQGSENHTLDVLHSRGKNAQCLCAPHRAIE